MRDHGVASTTSSSPPWVCWFNEIRLHSEIGYVTPIEFEQHHYRQNHSQQHPLLGEPSLH